ncbi:YibE/F family protein [Candidatus Falkowbacteria bacterium]|nr:YibE/F family protein [Candidatus Falkowbacteria bacterium]
MVLKKVLLLFVVICGSLALPFFFVSAQEKTADDTTFKGIVLEVTEQQLRTLPDGAQVEQQNLRLKGLEGEFKDRVVNYYGIGDVDVIKKNIYQQGDKVLVVASSDDQGQVTYYVTDYVRTGSLLFLSIIFLLSLVAVGGWKGVRSVMSLTLSFVVIMKYIVPQIIGGADPITVTVIGSFVILMLIIYMTEGFNKLSHLSVVSIFISLLITVALSWLFVDLARLSGLASEESSFLIGVGTGAINFQGLLMAGIIIGALGVLDDIVISQVATAMEIHKTDSHLSRTEIFKRTYSVGISHISSMTNTLFLAYAGASLSLLVLFGSGQSGFVGWGQALNNELIATEIVRTMAGSVGLVLSVPVSTFLAAWWVKRA